MLDAIIIKKPYKFFIMSPSFIYWLQLAGELSNEVEFLVSLYNLSELNTITAVIPPAWAGGLDNLLSENSLASKQFYSHEYLEFDKEIKEISLRIQEHLRKCPLGYNDHPLNPLRNSLHYNY